MKCLSVRQPWAWLIIHGGKDVENRTWSTDYRGPLLIHASKGMTKMEYIDAREYIHEYIEKDIRLPNIEDLLRGFIIGKVNMIGCFDHLDSEWQNPGCYGFLLENPEAIEPIPYKGQLGFFNVNAAMITGRRNKNHV